MSSEQNNSAKKPGLVTIALIAVSVAMVTYHAVYLFFPMVNAILHQNIHLAFAFTLLSLVGYRAAKSSALKIFWVVVCLVSLAECLYIHLDYERLHMWAGYPEDPDVVVGIILVALVGFFGYLHWGIVFPLLAGTSVCYALFGHMLSGPLGHAYLDPKLVLSTMSIGFDGIYGMMLNTSANVIFFFVIFGALFESVGITRFFQSIGRFIGGKMRGGAAVGSVASSSLLGMCTGGSMVNVALAGSFTMPMMVEAGFKPTLAGGIEACASTGGGLTPPVMGIAIFIMASFLNMTYIELMPAAVLPAVFFYFGLFLGLVAVIKRDNIPMCRLDYNPQAIALGAPVFLIPITLLCILLFNHYTPAYAAFWTTLVLIAVAAARKATRPGLSTLLHGLAKGCESMASLALVLAIIGIFVAMINLTNAGPKLSNLIQMLSGGYMIPSLVLTMVLCLLLGCALPAPVAYMVVALVVSPSMKDMGIPVVTTHLFCFYFSFLSNITPPVAGSSMVAARMLGCSFMRTAWESFKFSLPFFVVPYFAIYNPVVVMQAQNPVDAVIAIIALILCCVAISAASWGYFRGRLNPVERLIFAVSAIICTIGGLESGMSSLLWSGSGLALFLLLAAWRMKQGSAETLFPHIRPEDLECVVP